MMKSSIFNFEFKVIALMFFIFIIVLITGVSAYYRFSSILAKISETVRPDTRLVLSHSLKNDLAELSNIAKSHSLTEDFTYRKNYILIRNKIWEKLDELKDLNNTSGTDLDILKLDSLVSNKLVVLDGIIYSEDPFRVQTALGKVVLNIDQSHANERIPQPTIISEKTKIKEDEDLVSIKTAGEKISKLNKDEEKILKKKKKAEKRSKTELIAELDSLLNARQEEARAVKREVTKIEEFEKNKELEISAIYKGIETVSHEELGIEKKIKVAQLSLLEMDNLIGIQINNLFDEFEIKENFKIAETTRLAELENEKTNNYFALFTVFVAVLLLVMAYIIIQYVKKNNLYKMALKRSKFETDQLVKTRERLISTITHEIRTPMHAISGFAAQLSKSELKSDEQEYVKMIRTSAEHLTYLVNDVLDLSKLQSGKLKLSIEPFNLKELASEVVSFSKELVQDGRLSISAHIDEQLNENYLGDKHRLRQILLNLMSNAVKFTDRGAVELNIALKETAGKDHYIQLLVEDTGIGMTPENLQHVFEEFQQFGARKDNKIAGTGLGLSITKKLIELHKGSINIVSEKGKGTTITIDLKLEQTDERPKDFSSSSEIQLACKSILIVDDESYNRKLLQSIFKSYDIEVFEAINGREALATLENNKVDLMLLDARMPIMDGMQTMLALKEKTDISTDLKVILLTAAGNELGELVDMVDGYVAKPFSEALLIMEINRIMKAQNTPMNNKMDEAMHLNSSIDFTQLRSLSGTDTAFYLDMLQTFKASTISSMETLQIAFANDDFDTVANEAHKISSPCRHLGALKMYQMLKDIESIARQNEDSKRLKSEIKQLKDEVQIVLSAVDQELATIG